MKRALFALLLSSCAPPPPLSIEIAGDKADLDARMKSLSIEIRDEKDVSLATQQVDKSNLKLAPLRLPRGQRLKIGVTGFGANGERPLFFGTNTVDIPEAETETAKIAVLLAPMGQFSTLPVQPAQTRSDPSVVRLDNGQIWIIGGRDSAGAPLGSIDIFDPARLVFLEGPMLANKRSNAAVAVLDVEGTQAVVIAGGEIGTGVSQTVEVINAATFEVKAPVNLTSPRTQSSALVLPDSRVVICGGVTTTDSTIPEDAAALASCDVIDVHGDLSATVSTSLRNDAELTLPHKAARSVALSAAGRFFFVISGSPTIVTELALTDGVFGDNVAMPTMRNPTFDAAIQGTTIYVGSGGSETLDAWRFDPKDVPRSPIKPLGVRNGGRLLALPSDGIIVAGGTADAGLVKTNILYEPTTTSITRNDLVTPRSGHRLITTRDGVLLVIGGLQSPQVEMMGNCVTTSDSKSPGCRF
jgi:hypothetical protein